ncbi:MAG: hypothetical protein CL610_24020 [Anaerolineaceae bacterium]|nr:hypothetical protein [Anaerolineaceae bacterium]
MKRGLIWTTLLLMLAVPLLAQDGLNLPAAMYVLNTDGRVNRYGLGAEGVQAVTPEDDFVVDFGVAPDGVHLAYRTEQALIIQNIYSGVSTGLDGALGGVPSVRGRGSTVAWTPAGDAIAVTTLTGGRVYFNTENDLAAERDFMVAELPESPLVQLIWSPDGRYLAGEAEGDVWWLYRRENNRLILTSAIPSSKGLAWFNDTTVVFAPQEGGLRLMDLNAANAQTVLLDETWVYANPHLRDDGTLLVFGRQKDDPSVPEGYARLIGLPNGESRIDNLGEVAIEMNDLRWTPDGQLMMALRGGTMALVSPINAQSFPLPVNSVAAYDWGVTLPPEVEGPLLPDAGFFLALDDSDIAQVWRLPGDGSPPEVVTSAATDVVAFAVAPDASRVAYVSGSNLMVQALNGTDPLQLAEVSTTPDTFPGVTQPAFSPDSQQIAYNDGGIWVVPAAGGDPRLIVADEIEENFARHFVNPVFAPNINAMLIRVRREMINVPALLDTTTGEVIEIAVEQQAAWLADGRIVLYGIAAGARPGGLSIAGTGSVNQPAQFLPDILSVQAVQEIAPNQLRLVLPERFVGPRTLRVGGFDVTTGTLTPVHSGGFLQDGVLSPDGQVVAGYLYRARQAAEWDDGRGPLTFYNLETNEQTVLAQPAAVWHFVWA